MCCPRYSLNTAGYDYRYGSGYDYELAAPYGYGMAGMPYSAGYGTYPYMGGGNLMFPAGGQYKSIGCPKDRRYRPLGICAPVGMPVGMGMGADMYGAGMMSGVGGYGTRYNAFGFQSNAVNPLIPYTRLRRPFAATCFRCGSVVTTVTHHKIGTFGAVSALCLSVLGMCWLPLCCKSFKDVIHYCPSCGAQIAVHKTAY